MERGLSSTCPVIANPTQIETPGITHDNTIGRAWRSGSAQFPEFSTVLHKEILLMAQFFIGQARCLRYSCGREWSKVVNRGRNKLYVADFKADLDQPFIFRITEWGKRDVSRQPSNPGR